MANSKEPTKPIVIVLEDGTEYTLEFNREAVVLSERDGFRTDDVQEKMMTRLPQLFYYAFKKNHPMVTQTETDRILFEELGGVSTAMVERLIELYADAYMSLVNDEGKPKNPKVRVKM